MLLVVERQKMAAPAIGLAPDHSKHGVFNHGNSRSYIYAVNIAVQGNQRV